MIQLPGGIKMPRMDLRDLLYAHTVGDSQRCRALLIPAFEARVCTWVRGLCAGPGGQRKLWRD